MPWWTPSTLRACSAGATSAGGRYKGRVAARDPTTRVNDRGQTALACAVFRRDEGIVTALLAAGADPALGERSALVIADYFGLAEMTAILRGGS